MRRRARLPLISASKRGTAGSDRPSNPSAGWRKDPGSSRSCSSRASPAAPQRDVDGQCNLFDRREAIEPVRAHVARQIEQLVGRETDRWLAVQHRLISRIGRHRRATVLGDQRLDRGAVDHVAQIERAGPLMCGQRPVDSVAPNFGSRSLAIAIRTLVSAFPADCAVDWPDSSPPASGDSPSARAYRLQSILGASLRQKNQDHRLLRRIQNRSWGRTRRILHPMRISEGHANQQIRTPDIEKTAFPPLELSIIYLAVCSSRCYSTA